MKRIFAFVLCAAMLLGLGVHVAAEGSGNFLFDCTAAEGDSLLCFGAALPEGGNLNVTAGGGAAAYQLTTPEQAQLPITYYCMVDQSSALSNVQRDTQKEALLLISEKMRPQDKMVLILMHETLTFGEPLQDPEARNQAIQDACVYTSRFTTLYSYLLSAMEQISNSEVCPGLRCMILFSDGINDKNSGVTEDEVREAARSFRFPFHTISIINTFPDAYALRNIGRMDSFSQETPGGATTSPVRDKVPTEDAVNQVMQAMLGCSVIRVDAANLDHSIPQAEIQMLWQAGEESRTGTVTADLSGLVPAPTEPETVPETEPAETVPETIPETEAPVVETVAETEPETTETTPIAPTMDEESRYQKESKRSRDTLIVGAVVLLVVIIIVLLLLRRKSNDPEERGETSPDSPEETPVLTPQMLVPTEIPDFNLEFSQDEEPKAEAEPFAIPELSEEAAKDLFALDLSAFLDEKPEAPAPEQPEIPEEPIEEAESAKPIEPVVTVESNQPEKPVEPVKPEDPVKPEEPVKEAKYEKPVIAVKAESTPDTTQVLSKAAVRAAATAPAAEQPAVENFNIFLAGLGMDNVPGADVRLEPTDDEDATVEFFLPINTAMSLGRTAKSDIVLNKDDRALSGKHFELQWDGRALFLRDAKSTNGTGINGVPMRAGNWVRVNNGALIRAGAFKYKVYAFKAK